MLFEQMFERLVMSRNYGASTRSLVQVRTDTDGLPKGFSWRGRKYVVLAILFTWLEAAPWWRTARQWQVWRVEATQVTQKDSGIAAGVYDIATSDQRWFVRRVMD
jgi:hypothetical protein